MSLGIELLVGQNKECEDTLGTGNYCIMGIFHYFLLGCPDCPDQVCFFPRSESFNIGYLLITYFYVPEC